MSHFGGLIALLDEFEAILTALAAAEHRLDLVLQAGGNAEAEEDEIADLRSRHETLRIQLRNSGMFDGTV